MMALSGVRNSWLIVARKRLLEALARSCSARAISMACSVTLRSLTSRSTATTSRSPVFGLPAVCSRGRQRISTQMKCAAWCSLSRFAADAEFHRAGLAMRRGIGQRGQEGRAVGDMDAVEHAVAVQVIDPHAEQSLRPPATRTVRNHCVRWRATTSVILLAKQAVTVFFGGEQQGAGARQRLGAKRKARGIEGRRSDAQCGQVACSFADGRSRRQKISGAQRSAADRQRQARRSMPGHNAARRRERGFQRNGDKPDRSERGDTSTI